MIEVTHVVERQLAEAQEFLRTYTGGFPFLLNLQGWVAVGKPLSSSQITSILRCKARMLRESKEAISASATAMSQKSGRKGGLERARRLSPEQRSAAARRASAARWGREYKPIVEGVDSLSLDMFGKESLDVAYLDAWAKFMGQSTGEFEKELANAGYASARTQDGRSVMLASLFQEAFRARMGGSQTGATAQSTLDIPEIVQAPILQYKKSKRARRGTVLDPKSLWVNVMERHPKAKALTQALRDSREFNAVFRIEDRLTRGSVVLRDDDLPFASIRAGMDKLHVLVNRGKGRREPQEFILTSREYIPHLLQWLSSMPRPQGGTAYIKRFGRIHRRPDIVTSAVSV